MIGSVVGNYRITDKLGEGGMGAVFKGVDMMLEREVAIKVLRPEYASQPELVERFRSEAVTLAKLNHPNIATLHGFFRQANDFFMVMEFLRGETLDSLIQRSGAMSVERAVSMFCQALDGIGHAHSLGIIHRDIKPANIMLTDKGAVKVMDFGIARVLGTARMTRQGSIVGTIAYMSPEQIQGLDSDARADIYSLGILLYEMLTGRVPFVSDTEFSLMMAQIQQAPPPPRAFAPHIPVAVEQAIMRSLAKRPEARFQSVAEFRGAIEARPGIAPTQVAQPPAQMPPPTRLGAMPQPGETINPTRLATDPVAAPPGGFPPPYSQPGYVQPYPVQTQASLFSRLNWKHYAGAAVVLVILLATPFALMSLLKQQVTTQKPATVNPQATAPTPAAPVTEPAVQTLPSQPATTPAPPPAPAPNEGLRDNEVLDNAAVADGGNRNKPSGRSRKETDAERAARERARKRAEARRLLDQ